MQALSSAFDHGRLSQEAKAFYQAHMRLIHERTDRMFALLMLAQWVAAIAISALISPQAWAGSESGINSHVSAAIFLGGAIAALPMLLSFYQAGQTITRYTVAVSQMMMSALLIHLMGGRIESHFHIFGSLAFLAFYRDWRLIVTGSLIITLDHFARGLWWPYSIYGTNDPESWRWLEHAGWIVFESVFLIYACVASNHDLRRAAERQARLKANEERFRATFNQAAVGIAHFSQDGYLQRVNQRMCDLVGSKQTELLKKTFMEVACPADPGAHAEELQAVISGNAPLAQLETHTMRKDGSFVWLNITVSAVKEPDEPDYFMAVCEDITERKNVEESLEQNRRQIQSLNERLQRAMTETHHRVKNNLQIIAAMVDMQLTGSSEGASPAELKRLISSIRALAAVHDILTHEAKEDGQAHDLSAKAILSKLLPLIQETAGGRALRYELSDARLSARQGTSLALIANELVSNALKHCDGQVNVRFEADEDAATLEVSDNGPGFPDNFDPLSVANTGLELVENLARWDLGGKTRYFTMPQGGGSVLVTIPLISMGATHSPSLPSSPPAES